MRCPCGTGRSFAECCQRLHETGAAATAEQLMRSRYSAFATGDTAYLLRSWHSSTRPRSITLDKGQEWTRLMIERTERGGLLDQEGRMEFRALFTHRGRADEVHERSQFSRENGVWVYVKPTQGAVSRCWSSAPPGWHSDEE